MPAAPNTASTRLALRAGNSGVRASRSSFVVQSSRLDPRERVMPTVSPLAKSSDSDTINRRKD